MKYFLLWAVLGSAAGGCGDNSKQCGAGTIERNGVCEPDGTEPPACTGGTILDEETSSCVLDPEACQDGTVLVGSECKDPGHLTADVEEGAEPNGLAVLGEDSIDPAGTPVIKAVGETTVIHGKIIPFQDVDGDGQTDPDVDTYLVTVTEPALVTVSADGLFGMVGGLVSIADVAADDPLSEWVRIGVAVSGDTAKRQLYLPVAGTYALAIADTRTVLTGAAAGKDTTSTAALDFEYYVSITQQTAAATALAPVGGLAQTTGMLAPGEVKLFTIPMGLGVNTTIFETPDEDLTGSTVVTRARGGSTLVKRVSDEDVDLGQAVRSYVGFLAGDTTTIVADHAISFTNAPIEFELTVVTGDAGALSRTGGTVTQPLSASAAGVPGTLDDQLAQSMTVFFYDVAAANEIDGIDLALDSPVTGVLVDENFDVVVNFTFDPTFDLGTCGGVCGFAFEDVFGAYTGHLRHRAAGRHYLLVFIPGGTGDLGATSTITAVTPGVIVKDTVGATQTVNPDFESNLFTYDAGTAVAWQQFNARGTGTGTFTISYFDPVRTFGRLDPLANTCGAPCDDRTPRFSTTHDQNGFQPRGRILIDDVAAMGGSSFLVTVATANAAGTFDLNFNDRPHLDFGTLNAGDTEDRAGQVLENTITGNILVQRYLLRTARNNEVDLAIDSSGGLDAQIQPINNDESPRGAAIDNGGLGGIDTATLVQGGDGWTAWTVTSSGVQGTDETFSQDVTILDPP